MADLADVLKSALDLNRQDRATLAERIIASLDDAPGAKSDEEWVAIARQRLDDFDAGLTKAIPAEEVHKRIQELLK